MVDLGDPGPVNVETGHDAACLCAECVKTLMEKSRREAEALVDAVYKEKKVGTIEAAVQTDLDRLGKLDTGVRGSMAQVALKLARALDNQPDDAGPTTTARLAQELRTTLLALMGVNTKDGTGLRELFDLLSRPVRDAADAGTQESR